jgi:hypothetical protein
MKPLLVFVCLAAILTACNNTALKPDTAKTSKQEQDLVITFGGFIKDGPETEKLEGVCGTDYTRNVLNCDIYNGLLSWNVTELTFEIVWSPYNDETKRFFRNRVSIPPMTTSHVSFSLGMQLPPDVVSKSRNGIAPKTYERWSWIIAGAKGEHV